MSCKSLTLDSINECGEYIRQPEYSFFENCCYRDGQFFGNIIYKDETVIKVVVGNGNKYMKGQIKEFQLK